jgi:hypothetical protein
MIINVINNKRKFVSDIKDLYFKFIKVIFKNIDKDTLIYFNLYFLYLSINNNKH